MKFQTILFNKTLYKMRRLKNLILGGLLILVSASVFGQQKLPSVSIHDANKNVVDLASYASSGGPKIISIWATWCGPCRMELNALNKVYDNWKEKYNIEIATVTVDVTQMLPRAQKMFEKNGWSYTFFHDNDQKLMKALGIKGIPYSILVDGDGKVQSVQTGYYPGYEKELEKKLKSL